MEGVGKLWGQHIVLNKPLRTQTCKSNSMCTNMLLQVETESLLCQCALSCIYSTFAALRSASELDFATMGDLRHARWTKGRVQVKKKE